MKQATEAIQNIDFPDRSCSALVLTLASRLGMMIKPIDNMFGGDDADFSAHSALYVCRSGPFRARAC